MNFSLKKKQDQQHNGCHGNSKTGVTLSLFVMYISGAKLKEHCSNISRDMLDRVLNCFSETTYDVITHDTKT